VRPDYVGHSHAWLVHDSILQHVPGEDGKDGEDKSKAKKGKAKATKKDKDVDELTLRLSAASVSAHESELEAARANLKARRAVVAKFAQRELEVLRSMKNEGEGLKKLLGPKWDKAFGAVLTARKNKSPETSEDMANRINKECGVTFTKDQVCALRWACSIHSEHTSAEVGARAFWRAKLENKSDEVADQANAAAYKLFSEARRLVTRAAAAAEGEEGEEGEEDTGVSATPSP